MKVRRLKSAATYRRFVDLMKVMVHAIYVAFRQHISEEITSCGSRQYAIIFLSNRSPMSYGQKDDKGGDRVISPRRFAMITAASCGIVIAAVAGFGLAGIKNTHTQTRIIKSLRGGLCNLSDNLFVIPVKYVWCADVLGPHADSK
jgi:hypothetical protein